MVRKLFLWKLDVEKQKADVGVMREKNESLLYNLLPSHVADEFMKGYRSDEVSEEICTVQPALIKSLYLRQILALVLAGLSQVYKYLLCIEPLQY